MKVKKPRQSYPKDLPKEYKKYLIRCNTRDILLELTIEQFYDIIAKPCTYCGEEISKGIDRQDYKKDYTIENSLPCCSKCNTMKFVYSTEVFLNHINKIYLHNKV